MRRFIGIADPDLNRRLVSPVGEGYRDLMYAKIYRPRPSAMSSGRANSQHWVLEFESDEPHAIDPLTGNAISSDTREQVRMTFDRLEEAVAFAKANDMPHRVHGSTETKRIPRSYSENFDFNRKLPWTH